LIIDGILPAINLTNEAFTRDLIGGFDPDLLRATFNTILFAPTATIVALLLGFGACSRRG